MERLKSGDTQALAPLYRRYRGVVNAVLVGQSGRLGANEAEDLCHDVFLTLLDIAPRYRAGTTLRGWVCGIAVKKARRHRLRRAVRDGLLGRFFRPREVDASAGPRADARLDVARVLDKLPAPMREVVVMSFIEQLSAEDIAAALGISVNTVWTRLHRARARVKELLAEEGA